ncbi:dicarboxylate transporter 1, chloroplastic [Rosa sericea]
MASLALTTAPLPSLRSRTAFSKSLLLKPSPRLRAQTRPGPLRTAALGFNKTLSPLIAFPKLAESSREFAPLRSRGLTVKAAAATTGGGSIIPAKQPWQGAAMKPLIASIATGVILWFVPTPAGVTKIAWQLLAIFLATIVGIITQPLPLGAVALLGLGAAVLTKTLTFAAAFSAFGDPIPWLIALAFFFARGFIKTGLGNRIAYQFVSLFGSSSLGLGYSLVFSEALLAPAIPSVSARAGGIFLPLVKSLCVACGSNVGDGTEGKLGSWLMLTCFQTSVISSAMFLTAMAANPLSANLTFNTIKQTIGWTDWARAAIVPGLVSLIVVPLLLYVIYPPSVKSSPDAPKLARENLENMGPMSKNEIIMAGTLFLTVWLSRLPILLICFLYLLVYMLFLSYASKFV